jgi:mannan endo-1,4-beta-mannosidase
MHDSTGYGVGWSDDDDRSDVKSVCSDYPAVYSEDLTGVFHPTHRARMRYRLSSAYRRGGVLTLCWHQLDPDGRGFYARDVRKERIVATILPGGTRHADYRARLQVIAGFLKSLRGPAGESIPVIFRPYHEHTGDWFWWGVPAHATTDEFVHLWQWTVRHMHHELNVHNTLWALSPPLERVGTEDAYSVSYPGDPYVDIFGMDAYFPDTVEQDDIERFRRRLRVVVGHARARNKLAALTEVGQENLRTKDWFTRVLLDPIKSDPVNRHIVYSVVWRNAGAIHHFAPYPGHPAVPDFLEFFRDPFTIFGGNIPEMYQHPDKGAGGSPGTIAADGLAAPAGRPAEEKGTVRLVSLASSGPRGDRGPYER